MSKIKFKNCNCEIDQGKFDVDNIPFDCPATYNLISTGFTVGVFQIESRLGSEWSKKVKPQNIEELSALTALLRPGSLESGQSDEYVDVKFGKKQPSYIHQTITKILEPTYNSMIYQEQMIQIAKDVAGFSLEEADNLRKACGKKSPELMASLKQTFIVGCENKGLINKENAEKIFDWIEKSQRYSFNKSHAISYGMLAYQTAYLKAHFPTEFFTSYLTYSDYKADSKEEVYRLVQDSRLFDIEVRPPDVRVGNIDFKMNNESQILFGLSHIRNVGSSAIEKIIESSKNLNTWYDFLKSVPSLHRNVGIALIQSGACDHYNMSRSQMIHELEIVLGKTIRLEDGSKKEIRGLTDKEKKWFFDNLTKEKTMKQVLQEMCEISNNTTKKISTMKKSELIDFTNEFLGEYKNKELLVKNTKDELINLLNKYGYQETKIVKPCTKKRVPEIENKILELNKTLIDTNTAKAIAEKYYLGIAISCSPADDADSSQATHTCLDIIKALDGQEIKVCAIIDNVKPTKTKRGKKPGSKMCFLTISDSTYSIDHAIVFPDIFEKVHSLCIDGYICLISGYKKNGSFFIQNMEKLI